jgi:hypothetical protein
MIIFPFDLNVCVCVRFVSKQINGICLYGQKKNIIIINLVEKSMDQFLDAGIFATAAGGIQSATNGKKATTGISAISPVTSPTISASASGGTRVYIYECFSSLHLLDFVMYVVRK